MSNPTCGSIRRVDGMSEQQAPSIYPVLRYSDPAAGMAFLEAAFGFRVHEVHEGPDGEIAYAEVGFGDGMVMVGPSGGGEAVFDTGAQSIYVVSDDVDALHDRVVAVGAEIVFPLTDQDYGSCRLLRQGPGRQRLVVVHLSPDPRVMTAPDARAPVVLGPGRAAPTRWAGSPRSSRPTAPRPPAGTRSRSGGSSRTPRGPAPTSTPRTTCSTSSRAR